jgi:tetratricopeptide (TPR) repeat protein
MAPMQFPNLAYTYQDSVLRDEEIGARVAVLSDLIQTLPREDSDRKDAEDHRRLLGIQRAVTAAHAAFRARRYQEALSGYEQALAQVLQHLRPSVSRSVWQTLVQQGTVLRTDLTNALANVAYQMLARLPDTRPPTASAVFSGLPRELETHLARFEAHGIHPAEALPSSAQVAADIGLGYASSGRPRLAVKLFEAALGNAGDIGPNRRAGLLLNVGAAQVQAGEGMAAARNLQEAADLFRQAENLDGVAHAHQNLGVLFEAGGNDDLAKEHFATAQTLFDRAHQVDLRNVPPVRFDAVERGGAPEERFVSVVPIVGLESRSVLEPAPSAQRTLAFVRPGADDIAANVVSLDASPVKRSQETVTRAVGLLVQNEAVRIPIVAARLDGGRDLIRSVYDVRIGVDHLDALVWRGDDVSDFAAQLPHLVHFTLPLAIGDCLHHLGRFAEAESRYTAVAGYRFLNLTIEAMVVWQRLAENYQVWGDTLYRADEPEAALDVYLKVITEADGVPEASVLFSTPNLKIPADQARAFYADFTLTEIDPARRTIILEIRARLAQLAAGLDFFGQLATRVPIFTFRYLQDVARLFAERAIQAEREYIRFQVSADNDAATRQQLQQTVERAQEEVELQQERIELAAAQQRAAEEAERLAILRRQNAEQARDAYKVTAEEEANLQHSMAWYSSQNPWELDKTIKGQGPDAGRHIHEVMADKAYRQAQIRKERELLGHQNTIEEMQQAEAMASDEVDVANAQRDVADKMKAIAETARDHANESLNAFNDRIFTPELWQRMGWVMQNIARRHLDAAIEVAKRMERAYNFEHDTRLTVIKNGYAFERAMLELVTDGHLAGDTLLADLESFTLRHIVSADRKPIPVKQTISLASRYPFLFHQFRFGALDPAAPLRRGLMRFSVPIDDFDEDYPGAFRQRLEAVELEVDGLLPPDGVHGRLSIGGLSRYWTLERDAAGDFQQKVRLQPVESLFLSDYRVRQDTLIYRLDPTVRGLFEGAGVASAWELELPLMSNDLDFRLISDVRLVLYYTAFYDSGLDRWTRQRLRDTGDHRRSMTLPLRQRFPDAYFAFQDNGVLTFDLSAIDFPLPHQDPQLDLLALQLIWDDGTARTVEARMVTPGQPAGVEVAIGADGRVSSSAAGPLAPVAAGSALGAYRLEVVLPEAERADILNLQDVLLFVGYAFTPLI